jgi:hypothetical protein
MSVIGLIMNLLLAGLLVAALVVGFRLNRRLKVLRDSHDGFEAAVRELNLAAARAEQGLADLRAATDEATDLLADRIEKGRALAAKLERHSDLLTRQTDKMEKLAADPRPLRHREAVEDPMAERRLGALLAAAREARPERRPTPPPQRSATETFARPAPDPVEAPAPVRQRSPMEIYAERSAQARRRSLDDELFADEPFTLNDVRGVRR